MRDMLVEGLTSFIQEETAERLGLKREISVRSARHKKNECVRVCAKAMVKSGEQVAWEYLQEPRL